MTLFLHVAQFTYDELRATAKRVGDDIVSLRNHGIVITAVAVDERGNRVEIDVDPVNDEVAAEFADRYGAMITLTYVPVGHVPVATWPVDSQTLTAVLGNAQTDLVSCGGGPGFPAAVIDDPNYLDAPAGPARDALDEAIGVFGMEFRFDGTEHWRLADETEDTAMYLTKTKDGWVYAAVGIRDGVWGPAGMGDCRPMSAFPDGLGPASWELDPNFPTPTADTTELHILVWELACSGGSPATGRMASPIVSYEADSMVMTIGVTPIGGPATCPGPPGTPAMVILPQPLGNRTLLDGRNHPPQPPQAY
jgi:hypothetical protein